MMAAEKIQEAVIQLHDTVVADSTDMLVGLPYRANLVDGTAGWRLSTPCTGPTAYSAQCLVAFTNAYISDPRRSPDLASAPLSHPSST